MRDQGRPVTTAVREVATALLILVLPACAPVPAPSTTQAPPQRPDTTRAASAPASAPASVFREPSSDALQVLDSIPDPLRPEERVPPPEATLDTTGTSGETSPSDDSTGTDVPIPTFTFPLGQGPPPPPDTSTARASSPEPSTTATAPSSPPSSAPPPAAPPPPASAAPASCWRLQVGAPTQRSKAESLRNAAESQLLVPVVIETEKRLFKVRTRDCLDRSAADRLRERALSSGFSGAFLFEKRP